MLFVIGPALFGLHRLGIYLERRGLIDDSHKNSSGGTAYCPLQEIYQPQIRNVIEVRDQRLGAAQDDVGAPPDPEAEAAAECDE